MYMRPMKLDFKLITLYEDAWAWKRLCRSRRASVSSTVDCASSDSSDRHRGVGFDQLVVIKMISLQI